MKVVYSLPHPADRLTSERSGHVVRANAVLDALAEMGHDIIRVEAAAAPSSQVAVSSYRRIIRKLMPRPIAMKMRDAGRVAYGKRFAARLIKEIEESLPDVILETHIAFTLAGRIASETTGIPLILDDVSPAWEEEQQYGVGLKQLARSIHREVTEHASLLVAVNKTIHQYLIEEGLPPAKLVTIENGIDARLFHPNVDGSVRRVEHGLGNDEIVIVFVGSFQPYHRVDLLLEAFAQIETGQPTHLLLVGEGRTTPACKARARELGLTGHVTFTGRIPYDQVASYVAAGDIAIMPATNEYGNPMKVYEYMAMGKAVVAPNQETITDIATHGQDAYLFKPGSVPDMAEALETMCMNPALREELGDRARILAAEHTWQKRAERLLEAIQERGLV